MPFTNRLCFIDMDGVLTNFLGPALDLHGRSVAEVYADQGSLGVWETWTRMGITAEAFWKPIDDAGFSFWSRMPWTSEGKHILAMAEQVFGVSSVYLLSSPSQDPMSAAGKWAWVARELPRYARRLILCPCKGAVAGPGKVLIDDGDHNLEAWSAAGGRGVYVPRPWNRDHQNSNRVIGAVIEDIQQVAGVRFINFASEVR